MENLRIRRERPEDYRAVEEGVREAFWNLYAPGCDEHYLVHLLRDSPDYIPELTFVAELDGEIVGSIFFSKSYVVDDAGVRHDTITFGPVHVVPRLQGKGIGRALIEHAMGVAAELGYGAVLIYGFPGYYERFGFRNAKAFGISDPQGRYPVAHMAVELHPGALDGVEGKGFESPVFAMDPDEAAAYDASFPPKVKAVTPSQEAFAQTAGQFL